MEAKEYEQWQRQMGDDLPRDARVIGGVNIVILSMFQLKRVHYPHSQIKN